MSDSYLAGQGSDIYHTATYPEYDELEVWLDERVKGWPELGKLQRNAWVCAMMEAVENTRSETVGGSCEVGPRNSLSGTPETYGFGPYTIDNLV